MGNKSSRGSEPQVIGNAGDGQLAVDVDVGSPSNITWSHNTASTATADGMTPKQRRPSGTFTPKALSPYLMADIRKCLGHIKKLEVMAGQLVSSAQRDEALGYLLDLKALLHEDSINEAALRVDEMTSMRNIVTTAGKGDAVMADYLDGFGFTARKRRRSKGRRSFVGLGKTIVAINRLTSSNVDSDTIMERALIRLGVAAPQATTVNSALQNISSWDMDVFTIDKLSQGNAVVAVCMEALDAMECFSGSLQVDWQIVAEYLFRVQSAYRTANTYHNAIHAADVCQAVVCFLLNGFIDRIHITREESVALLVAAAAHDVNHPAVNNAFLVKTNHELAITYNDVSVLENMHAAEAFRIMNDPACDFLVNSKIDKTKFRKLVIASILGTDMANHFSHLTDCNTKIVPPMRATEGQVVLDSKGRELCLVLAVHTADVSNPARPKGVYTQWVDLVMEEFHRQGDQERAAGLEISPFMNRDKDSTGQCQQGFINFIVKPQFTAWVAVVPQLKEIITSNLDANLHMWDDHPTTHPKPVTPAPTAVVQPADSVTPSGAGSGAGATAAVDAATTATATT